MSFHPVGAGSAYRYVQVVTLDAKGRVLLSRHRDRATWEVQGGRIESEESVDNAALRELYEESGVVPWRLEAVVDHRVANGDDADWGRTFLAMPGRIDPLPLSEMVEIRWFDALPDTTYPWMIPAVVGLVRAGRFSSRRYTPH